MAKVAKKRPLFDSPIVKRAIKDAIHKVGSAAGCAQSGDVCR